VNPIDHVRQHDQPLHVADEAAWLAVGAPLGISAFEAKAYYTIGLVREMVAMAGLTRFENFHLGAIFDVLDAIELLGRAVGGFRHAYGEAGARLRAGLEYTLDLNSQEATPLVVLTTREYADLRNFTGHGAASSGGRINFDPWTGLALLHLTTRALDAMWADQAKMAEFAKCQIDALFDGAWTAFRDAAGLGDPDFWYELPPEEITEEAQAIYVRDVQTHLQAGKMPSAGIRFDEWRTKPIRVRMPGGVAHCHRILTTDPSHLPRRPGREPI
jgi:hypothetical protein